MKISDLVKYGSWYTGKDRVGLVLDSLGMTTAGDPSYHLVAWSNGDIEWEDTEEIECINGN